MSKKKSGNGGVGSNSETVANQVDAPTAPNSGVKRNADGTFAKGSKPMAGYPKGVSGNPGGQPRIIRNTWAEWLAEPNTETPDKTNARVGIEAAGERFLRGELDALREARTATEDTTINVNYKHQVVAWLQQGLITVDEVQKELEPAEAQAVLLAAGVLSPTQRTEEPTSGDIIDGVVTSDD